MSTSFHLLLIAVILIYFIVIIFLLKKKKLALKYTLLWMFVGIVLAVLAIFPLILNYISEFLGFVSSMNALFTLTIAFAFMLILALTSIVSNQSIRIKQLTQSLAILEKKVRDLENGQEY